MNKYKNTCDCVVETCTRLYKNHNQSTNANVDVQNRKYILSVSVQKEKNHKDENKQKNTHIQP